MLLLLQNRETLSLRRLFLALPLLLRLTPRQRLPLLLQKTLLFSLIALLLLLLLVLLLLLFILLPLLCCLTPSRF